MTEKTIRLLAKNLIRELYIVWQGREKKEMSERIACEHCNDKEAEIFTATGNYCVNCWQLITETGAFA